MNVTILNAHYIYCILLLQYFTLTMSLSFCPPPLKPSCQGRVIGFVGGGSYIEITIKVYAACCIHYNMRPLHVLYIIYSRSMLYALIITCVMLYIITFGGHMK